MNSSVKLLAAIVIILASTFWIFHSTRPPRGSATNHEYAGATVARELARLRGDKGGKILLIGFSGEHRVLNLQVDGFLGAIKKNAAFEVLGREDIDPPAADEGMMEGGGIPASAFAASVRNHKDADIIASFVGLPDFRDPLIASLFTANGPKLVVLNARAPELADLVDQGLVYLAVVNKAVNMADFTKAPPTPAAWFDRFFALKSAAEPAAK